MERIKQWLEHKDYDQGVKLYLEMGSDQNLIDLFTLEDRTEFKQKRLEKALRELMKVVPAIKVNVPEIKEFRPVDRWADNDQDTTVQALRKEAMVKYKEMKDLHAQLMLFPTDEERGRAAHRILELDDQFTSLLKQRDHYKEHGSLPDEPEPEQITDPIKVAQRMQTLQKYIRRERATMHKDPNNSKVIIRLNKFIKEYNQYAERFGRDIIPETQQASA